MTVPRLSAAELRAAFQSAERWLQANRDGINAINVYPVPDGDTGTNMLLTLRAALRGVEDLPETVGETAIAMSRAALLGARGNSGVILSQMIRGIAEALEGLDDTSGPQLVHALAHASDTAYDSVSQPVEGTMLTVLRDVATLARETLAREAGEDAILHALVDEAYASVERTPDLLPRLREAGVVDAGGAGIAVILEGVTSAIHDIPLPGSPRFAATEYVATEAVEHEGHGYCTEYLVSGPTLDLGAIERDLVAAGGDSLLVVGDEHTVHVHVHMEDPGRAISIGTRAGSLAGIKVENMQTQHEAWMASHDEQGESGRIEAVGTSSGTAPPTALGLVALARGRGIADAFRELGAGVVVELEGSSKASAGEIMDAARRAGTHHAIVLPNDRDIFMAAETAARESDGFLVVVPSPNMAAGLAAAIYYRPDGDPAAVAHEMTAALEEVHCIEVSTAVRNASVDGIIVTVGQAIALLDGRMHAACATHDEALLEALRSAVTPATEIVTVFLGAGVDPGARGRLASLVSKEYPDLEVEVVEGGQPHYPYLAAVE